MKTQIKSAIKIGGVHATQYIDTTILSANLCHYADNQLFHLIEAQHYVPYGYDTRQFSNVSVDRFNSRLQSKWILCP